METRENKEYKLYYLYLSDMRGNVDSARPVVGSFELNRLIEFYNKEKYPWRDENETMDNFGAKHGWSKTFKKGSQLEWFNDVKNLEPNERPDIFGGVGYIWIKNNIPEDVSIPII